MNSLNITTEDLRKLEKEFNATALRNKGTAAPAA
jgi:hypothetical protein